MTAGNGLIETLWAGFVAVHRRPGLIVIPLAVDLLSYLGPRISAAPLAEVGQRAVDGWAALARTEGNAVPADQIETAVTSMTAAVSALGEANLLNVLGWQLPGQLGYQAEIERFSTAPAIGQVPAVLTVLIALGVLLAGLYYSLIGNSIQKDQATILQGLSWVPLNSLRYSVWLAFTVIALVALALPFFIVVGLVGLLSQALAGLAFVIAGALLMLLAVLLSFVPSAIFGGRLSPFRAALASVRIVRRFPSDSLVFLGVVWTLMIGWPVVWGLISSSLLGGLVAIAGHAYLVTGLVAATMLFFLNKYDALQKPGLDTPVHS